MDSFAKALQKGLAKTVAVGQQQLQQRLAKYDQQNSNGNAAANTYGTGPQAQAQYGYHNQSSYQASPAVNHPPQHASYFSPPPPGSSQTQYQQHPQPTSQPYAYGQYASTVTSPAPSTTQSYNSPQTPATQASGYHGHDQQIPQPLPPANSYHPVSGYNEHTSWQPTNTLGQPATAPPTQQAYASTYQQPSAYSAPPVSSTSYPPALPPRETEQLPAGAYYPQTGYSQETPYRPAQQSFGADQGHVPVPPATQATPTSQPATAPSVPLVETNQPQNSSHSVPATIATSTPPASTQSEPTVKAEQAQQYQPGAPTNAYPPAAQDSQNVLGRVDSTQHTVQTPYQPVAAANVNPPFVEANQNTYGSQQISQTQQSQPSAATNANAPVTQVSQNVYGNLDSTPLHNAATTTPANQWTTPESKEPPSVPAKVPHLDRAQTQAPNQQYQISTTQQPTPPLKRMDCGGYMLVDNSQVHHTPAHQYPPPPEVRQNVPAAPFPAIPTYVPGLPSNVPPYQQPPQNDPSFITQQMNGLSINNSHPPQPDYARGPFQPVKPKLPPVTANGTPREVVRFCPEDRVVSYSLYWYRMPDTPEFLICTKCHEDNIQGTHLAGKLERFLTEEGSSSKCSFWHPRVKDHLWKQALQKNSLDDLRAYAPHRLAIPDCKGRETTVGTQGIKYFGMRNNEINGFIACEACHEDRIKGTTLESNFAPYNIQQGAEDKWSCDASPAYVCRALERFSKNNDWSGFVAGATRRLQLPVCEGKDVAASDGKWFGVRRKIDNFYVCGACYMDKLELTDFEGEFEEIQTQGGFDMWMELLGKRWICDLTPSSMAFSFALEAYLKDKDFNGFYDTAQTLSKLVPCTAKGIIRGNWWTLPGGCENYDICEACYIGVFKSNQLDKFLEPAERDPENTLICNFCPSSPRFNQFINKFAESLDRSVFSYYTDCVRKFANVPECTGIYTREKTKWWGYPGALFCESCYVGFVADTTLGPHVLFKGEYDERAQICQVWSPRMRGMWLAACNAGEPGSSESKEELDKFTEFCNKRLQIYLQTVPRIKFIKEMREMRMMNAMHQGQLSLMYQGMNSMAVLSDTTDGHLHGNSSIGWHETEHGATGAQMFNNMQAGFASVNRADEWGEVLRLQAMWCEVE